MTEERDPPEGGPDDADDQHKHPGNGDAIVVPIESICRPFRLRGTGDQITPDNDCHDGQSVEQDEQQEHRHAVLPVLQYNLLHWKEPPFSAPPGRAIGGASGYSE